MATFQFNETNWQQVWNTPVTTGTGVRRLICPQILNTNAIALLLSAPSLPADYRWVRGAYINREVRSGLVIAGQDALLDYSRRLYLNQLQIFTYESKSEFILIANCTAKGEGLNLFAWEYIG